MLNRAARFCEEMRRRRSVRNFSGRAVPRKVIEDCLATAGTAPSGANRQPWHFVVVESAETKKMVREAAEKEEKEFYHRRAPREWLEALDSLGTDEHKPFLETAPYLIAVFVKRYGIGKDGTRIKNYYAHESVGIAIGLLIAAIHNAGLVCLPYTPYRMGFLNEILGRPENERPFLLLVVGYPAPDTVVPDIYRKSLEEISTFI